MTLNFVENALGYFESNPAAHVPLSAGTGGVKLVVGLFELLFGTVQGEQLRAWCAANGWPLAWAYNPAMSAFRCGPAGDYPGCVFPPSLAAGMDSASVRLLDPTLLVRPGVAVGHNVTVPAAAAAAFADAWRATNASAYTADAPELAAAWSQLVGGGDDDDGGGVWESLGVEPAFFGACEAEACVGVLVSAQTCVCPP